jgi:hypothetical protein
MPEAPSNEASSADVWIQAFLQHLQVDRGASIYTQRNYWQALTEFFRWFQSERGQPPKWNSLQRDDFRSYLRFLGRGSKPKPCGDSTPLLRASHLLQIFDSTRNRCHFADEGSGNARPEKRCPVSDRSTDAGFAEGAAQAGRKTGRIEKPIEESIYYRDVGGPGDDLLVRASHQRIVRAAGWRH